MMMKSFVAVLAVTCVASEANLAAKAATQYGCTMCTCNSNSGGSNGTYTNCGPIGRRRRYGPFMCYDPSKTGGVYTFRGHGKSCPSNAAAMEPRVCKDKATNCKRMIAAYGCLPKGSSTRKDMIDSCAGTCKYEWCLPTSKTTRENGREVARDIR